MKPGVGDPSGERTLHAHHSSPLRMAHGAVNTRAEAGGRRSKDEKDGQETPRSQAPKLSPAKTATRGPFSHRPGDRKTGIYLLPKHWRSETFVQFDTDQSVMTGSLRLPGGLGASGGLRRGQKRGQGQPTRCPPGHVPQHCCPARPAGPPQGESRSRPVPPPPADTTFLSPLAKAKRYPKE